MVDHAMGFTPPKKSAFKQFVILDADGVVAALSAIDGGQIDEILTRSGDEGTGEVGGQLDVRVAKGGGKRARTRKVEEEVRRARTRHATAAKLLESLHAQEALGIVDGPLDLEAAEQIEEGMVLQFRADLRLHPLHQADQMLRSFIEVAPAFGKKQSGAEVRDVLKMWRTMIGTGRQDGRLLIEPHTAEPQIPRLVLPVPHNHFEIDVSDVVGEVTVVAQVERILGDDESFPAIRMLRGAPASDLERKAIEEALPGLIDGLGEMGIPIAQDDVFISGPALSLRAICAHR
jgi:hypothetical protein